jgi:hypothetical protein
MSAFPLEADTPPRTNDVGFGPMLLKKGLVMVGAL